MTTSSTDSSSALMVATSRVVRTTRNSAALTVGGREKEALQSSNCTVIKSRGGFDIQFRAFFEFAAGRRIDIGLVESGLFVLHNVEIPAKHCGYGLSARELTRGDSEMTLVPRIVLFALFLSCELQAASAALVQWQIDSAHSFLTLQIPTQPVSVGGTPSGNAFFRNQGATSGSWTLGNTAAIIGTISTDYTSDSITFLSGQHNLAAGNSGDYSPDPSTWNPGASQFSPRTSTAPAAFGGQIGTTAAGTLPIFINDGVRFSIRNVQYELTSGLLPISTGSFSASGTNWVASDGQLSASGNPLFSIPSSLGSLADTGFHIGGTNLAANGSIAVPDPLDPTLLRLTLPISVDITVELFDGGMSPLSGTASGMIVAYSRVPEPGSAFLAGLVLMGNAYRRRRA